MGHSSHRVDVTEFFKGLGDDLNFIEYNEVFMNSSSGL